MPLVRICPLCGTLNPESRRDCKRCGGPVSTIAPVDSASLPPHALEAGHVRSHAVAVGAGAAGAAPPGGPVWFGPPQAVVITGIEVPFAGLVFLLVKLATAAIPAMIILALLGMMISVLFAGISGAFAAL